MITTISTVLYLAGAFILMLFMYLVARFYRIKLDPNTPVIGFWIAMLSFIMAITGLLIGNNGNAERIFVDIVLFTAGIFGTWNSISLYVRMKRVHK